MCSCDFDPPSAYREVHRRARKEHRCCECRDVIAPGDTYVHISGVWDGRPDSFRRCVTCDAWADALNAAVNEHKLCVCPLLGDLHESLAQYQVEFEDHQRELARAARARENGLFVMEVQSG